METIDWQGSHNHLRAAMEESVENAENIATFTRNALHPYQSNPDPGYGILFTETDEKLNKLNLNLGYKGGSETTRIGSTKFMELAYADMSDKLTHFDDLTRPVFGKKTQEYANIWGPNRNRFYHGSYKQREDALFAMAGVMGNYPDLDDLKAEVLAYANELKSKRESQQELISGTKTYSAEVFNWIELLIQQMMRNLGWLNFKYALQPDAQAKVNAFFDLSRIMNHSHNKIYPCHVPINGSVKVCRRAFKITDKVKITIDGSEDVFLFCVPNSEWSLDPSKGYRAVSGTIIEKLAKDVFPDLTYKQVMGLNSSTTKPTHFEFEIIEE
jgi:hypothetical protein